MKSYLTKVLLMGLALSMLQCSDENSNPFSEHGNGNKPLARPELIAPVDQSTGVISPVIFEWTSIKNAEEYEFQLSESAAFASIDVVKTGLKTTTIVVADLAFETSYFWRVRASRKKQRSEWSELFQFTMAKQPVPTDDLIAYYPFSGNTEDESGNGHDGVLSGPLLTTDRFDDPNSAFLFDGVDDYIHVAHHDALNLMGDFTISAWFSSDGCETVCDPPGYHTIIMKREASMPDDNWPWGVSISYISNDPGPFLKTIVPSRRTDLELEYQWSTNTIVLNKWHHVVIVVENNVQTIYLDGAFDSSQKLLQPQQPNEKRMIIGSSLRSDGAEYFKGKIDDLRLYSRALSEDEVEALFNE